jgi:MFS family permease
VLGANQSATRAVRLRSGRSVRWRGLFAEADFRRLWLVGVAVFGARWLEMLVVGVFVYQHTRSALTVALITMLRVVPMALFGAVVGAVAERWERRTALIVVVVLQLTTSLSLAVLACVGWLAVWHLAVASFVSGLSWTTDNPVRRVMIGEVVGAPQMSAAMSIDVGANNASRMLGPTIGGLLLAGVGIGGAYMVSVSLYALALIAALRLRYRNRGTASSAGALARMIEGLMLVRGDRRLIGVLVITVIFNVFGWPFTSMVPVIGQDNLHLGARGIGVLASMDGIGAFLGAVAIALWAKPHHYSRLYIGGTTLYLVLLIGFVMIPLPLLAGAVLLTTGVAGSGFSIMQATLIYLAAPPDMRSRLYGVLSVCIGTGPLGILYLGLLADRIGAPWAATMIALEGLIALVLTRRWWRALHETAAPSAAPASRAAIP